MRKKEKVRKKKIKRREAKEGQRTNEEKPEKKSFESVKEDGDTKEAKASRGAGSDQVTDQMFVQSRAQQETEIERKQQAERRLKATKMVPMSKEQYEAEQSKIREVYDEQSGRYRLVRGSGEIIERIVSQKDHARINQTATRGDGSSFSRSIYQASRSRR